MGALASICESMLRVPTLGISDLLHITGKDGLIHDCEEDPENQPILFSEDGLIFTQKEIKVGWNDVKKIELFNVWLRGGLFVSANWDMDHASNYDYAGKIGEIKTLLDIDNSDFSDVNLSRLAKAVSDVLWASGVADKIRKSVDVWINELDLLKNYYMAYCLFQKVVNEKNSLEASGVASPKRFECFSPIFNRGADFSRILREQLERCVSKYHEDPEIVQGVITDDMVADAFALSGWHGNGISAQANRYDNLRNARAYGKRFENGEIVGVLTLDEGEFKPFGDEQWARRRKKIVCTDSKASFSTLQEGLQIQDVMVMDAQDINDYNNSVATDKQLKFEINHPENGKIYVQHPMQQNVYIDIDSFHSSLLDRKYEELKTLLDALGATSIDCSVEDNSSYDENRRRKVEAGVNVDVPIAGEASAKGEYRGASSKMRALYKKFQTHIENRRTNELPHVPVGLLFYEHEDGWKNLAENVIKGRRLEEETTLTYREDFAVTGQSLLKLEGRLKSVIPGYEFGVDANFSHEFEEELKQLKSTVWHYHVKFGAAQSEDVPRVNHPVDEHHDSGGASVPAGRVE